PTGGVTPLVFISADVSRASPDRAGVWRVTRHGDCSQALEVRYGVRGDAESRFDYISLSGRVTIPAGGASAAISLVSIPKPRDDRTVVASLFTDQPGYRVGCPAEALIVLQTK